MRLKTLELQGFKSFPDKTVLSFPHPITAIVGPNGSGKSNISDAIRWVLGEQSPRVLRGGRMEDVIFGGTQERQRQGFAQVSLTLEQCSQVRPDLGDEVTVTRRYYRSGESEYDLNRRQVRLRDVNELFMDTGLGQEGYALIGQGKIDAILSAKSTQRREIFEEAAGISHSRHQKEETQRKLERTQENLLRLGDKLEELDLQRAPLAEQAQRAKTHRAWSEELRVLEISLWMDRLDAQRAQGEQDRRAWEVSRQQLEACTQETEALYATGEALLDELRETEQRREEANQAVARQERARQDVLRHLDRLRERLTQKEAAIQAQTAALAGEETRRQTAAVALEERQAAFAQARETVAALEASLTQTQEAWEQAKARQTREQDHWTGELRRKKESLAQCRRREKQAEEAWLALRMEEQTLASRYRMLTELTEQYEGYARGVKTAMAAREAGTLSGVFGPVGTLFQTDPAYTLALETALGGSMQHLLVEDEEAGRQVLQLVKKTRSGRITCLPLTALRPRILGEEDWKDAPGALALAHTLVSCPDAVRPAAEALLGRTVVADTLEHAIGLAKRTRYRFPIVTLDGEILRPGGSMTGGSVSRQGSFLTRSREKEESLARLERGRAALHQGEADLAQARNATKEALDAWETAQNTLPAGWQTAQADALRLEKEVSAQREKLAAAQGALGSFGPLLDQLKAQWKTGQEASRQAEAQREEACREAEDLKREIARQEADLAEQEKEGQRLAKQLDGCREEKLRLEQRRGDLHRQAKESGDRQMRLQRESARLEQKALQASMEEARLLDRLWDTYGVTHEAARGIRVPVEDPVQAEGRAAQLSRDLRVLGPVNPAAEEEFQRLEARYTELKAQKDDIETARRELEDIIRGMTREMEERFLREFEKVQAAFQETFVDLFGGGRAALTLEDPKEVLSSGVEITVQPPGKTVRTISLLSGGERALVAIALYFAILKVHPTPFCVVDEMEAPLDEANSTRFVQYLKKMARDTQFLIITHRRETMEAADLLYGVTMEQQGVSRVLRMDLHQVRAWLEDGAE